MADEGKTPRVEALIRAMGAHTEPCRGCRWYDRCATQQLACGDFQRFIARPYSDCRAEFQPDDERIPTRSLYVEIFKADQP
ncbi:hypothetical protein [Aquisalimonas asiatica]|uniref:Uncharacterized protein n=1 Tax=Aquisalimonas asiatica TaxID=406100 RepID=A0A1H8UCE8_9GAMM|nr:hypothetical protein [Aquisalimonas asiatica]SEP00900.1 hypothetical protein SAMN04488052_10695 [Aquisalimonas asiatica]